MRKALLLFTVVMFISCADDEPILVPLCIDQEIPIFAQTACPGSGDLTLWRFDGQDVFCFNEGGCYADPLAYIYDPNCNLLCVIGGINGDFCGGLEWSSNAEYQELIYVY